ncbi:MAG TPA: Gfo/Idh/MocA family oxidoreductase [Opitutaceae bacterium]|nr:Gfo/Idh/MocA family oxidoreductase [Opitutaceae bacterium]
MNKTISALRWSGFSPSRWFVTSLVLLALSTSAHAAEKKLGIGLYGSNGHQLNAAKFANHANAQLVAIVGVRGTNWPESVKRYNSLDELIADPGVELVSLCSPRRADQARDAIRCLQAGKHVYAEKPSALTEAELDQVLAAAQRAGKEFHEMAGTVFAGNYAPIRKLVREGAVGEVIQVFVQKSYKYGQARPQDEAIDGGMFLQAGVHAVRMIEHAGGVRIKTITGWETTFGSPEKGDGKIAGAVQIGLENGGTATIIINYLNPGLASQPHGNETLRVFGTQGFIESVDGGARTRLVTKDKAIEPLSREGSGAGDYFDFVAAHLVAGTPMPLAPEEELHPLRMLLRAKEKMRAEEKGRAAGSR